MEIEEIERKLKSFIYEYLHKVLQTNKIFLYINNNYEIKIPKYVPINLKFSFNRMNKIRKCSRP